MKKAYFITVRMTAADVIKIEQVVKESGRDKSNLFRLFVSMLDRPDIKAIVGGGLDPDQAKAGGEA